MWMFQKVTDGISRARKERCEKTDSAKRAKTDTCQVPGTSAMSSEGVVSTLWEVGGWDYELAGYANVLLRACDAHGTRVPSMRPDERQ